MTEGTVSLLEPFIDTVVICTMTALLFTISGVLIIDPETGDYIVQDRMIMTQVGVSGVELTSYFRRLKSGEIRKFNALPAAAE